MGCHLPSFRPVGLMESEIYKTLIFGVSWGRPYIVKERSYREAGLGLGRVRVWESTVPYPRPSDPWKKCAAFRARGSSRVKEANPPISRFRADQG